MLTDAINRLLDSTEHGLRALSRVTLMTRAIVIEIPSPFLISAPSEADRALADVRARSEPGETITHDPDMDRVRITLPYRLRRTGGRVRVTDSSGRAPTQTAQLDDSLIGALKMAHGLVAERTQGKIGAIDDASFDAAPSSPYDRKIIRLAFLAPDLQAAILEGRQPVGVFRQRLINGEIPAAWADQRRLFKSL